MRTWNDWSDFEVNRAVAQKSGLVVSMVYKGSSEASVRNQDYNAWFNVDYCNNWADMGPLMFNNKISIMQPDDGDDKWNAIHWCDDGECMHDEYHANPLRAAAIVFLMMNGVKP